MSQSPENGENVISLQSISRNFLSALQRQHDMLAFSLAGFRTADPKAYEFYSKVSRVMPAPQLHLPPEQMLAYAHGLLLRTTINDLLMLSSECMNQCHLLCTLIKERGRRTDIDEAVERRIGESHQAFCRMTLQDKFNKLEEAFEIVCELEDGIFSLAAALRVLSRGGLVTNDDITPDGSLTLEFKAMKDFEVPADSPEALENPPPPEGIQVNPLTAQENLPAKGTRKISKLTDTQRTFKPGEMLNLTDVELLGLNITVAKFLDGLFRSVDFYGKNELGENK